MALVDVSFHPSCPAREAVFSVTALASALGALIHSETLRQLKPHLLLSLTHHISVTKDQTPPYIRMSPHKQRGTVALHIHCNPATWSETALRAHHTCSERNVSEVSSPAEEHVQDLLSPLALYQLFGHQSRVLESTDCLYFLAGCRVGGSPHAKGIVLLLLPGSPCSFAFWCRSPRAVLLREGNQLAGAASFARKSHSSF